MGKPEIKDEIHVYTRSDSAGAADQWALFSGGKVQADILTVAIGVNGEPALVDTVGKDPLGIGFSNLNSVFDSTSGKLVPGISVPPIDINSNGTADANEYYQSKDEAVKVIADGTYPSPPARFENLATKGKPTGLTLAFISWILTDGQQDLEQAGYVKTNNRTANGVPRQAQAMSDQDRAFISESIGQPEGRPQNRPSGAARLQQDQNARRAFSIITLLPVLLIVAITIALVLRAWPIIGTHPFKDTVLGVVWKPEQGSFGFWPFITGTAWVTAVGLLLAVLPCLLVSLYLSEYAHSATRVGRQTRARPAGGHSAGGLRSVGLAGHRAFRRGFPCAAIQALAQLHPDLCG